MRGQPNPVTRTDRGVVRKPGHDKPVSRVITDKRVLRKVPSGFRNPAAFDRTGWRPESKDGLTLDNQSLKFTIINRIKESPLSQNDPGQGDALVPPRWPQRNGPR